MGRLMDDVLAMFGIKPSDRVNFDQPQAPHKLSPLLVEDRISQGYKESNQSKNNMSGKGNTNLPQDLGVSNSSRIDKDCIGCRVVGASVCFGACAYVIQHTIRSKITFVGWRRTLYRVQGISLCMVLVNFGLCAAFGIGPFNHERKDMPVTDQLALEVATVYKWMGRKPPKTVQDMLEARKEMTNNENNMNVNNQEVD